MLYREVIYGCRTPDLTFGLADFSGGGTNQFQKSVNQFSVGLLSFISTFGGEDCAGEDCVGEEEDAFPLTLLNVGAEGIRLGPPISPLNHLPSKPI